MKEKRQSFLEGAVKICVSGEEQKRFLNLCKSGNLSLWEITTGENYTFWMKRKEIYHLKKIRRKTGCHVMIKEKYGLPFLLYRYRKRKMFFAGIAVSFLITHACSGYIWDLEVCGNYSYTEEEMLAFLKQEGIEAGIEKKEVDCDAIEKSIRNEFFDITWVSVEVSGTRLILHLKENEQILQENRQDVLTESNLVAKKDGIIKEIEMRSGTLAVRREMPVKQGDILVYGSYEIMDDAGEKVRTQYLAADADIYAQVEYSYEEHLPLSYRKKSYQKEKNCYGIRLSRGEVFFLKADEQENTECLTTEIPCSLYQDFYLPLTFLKKTYRTYEYEDAFYEETEAKKICEEKFAYFLENLEKNTIQIIENNVTIEVTDGECVARGSVVALESIGEPVPIGPKEELTGETETVYE